MAEGLDVGEIVENALRDAFTNEGGMVTGFSTVVSYIDRDGSAMFLVIKPANQSMIVTTGMLEVARLYNQEAVIDGRGHV